MLMIAAGYEDCDDVDALRTDPALKIAVGRCPESGADLMSQPTLSRLENLADWRALARIGLGQIDLYCRSFARPPKRIVLDIDDTDARVEATVIGTDVRFIVANLEGRGKTLYEKVFCARGHASRHDRRHHDTWPLTDAACAARAPISNPERVPKSAPQLPANRWMPPASVQCARRSRIKRG